MKKLLLGMALSAFASAAVAADIPAPVYKAPQAAVATANGFYLSLDGSWARTNLPDYALGVRQVTAGTFNDAGPMQSFSQHFDGYAIRGTVGYFLPAGISNSILGANTRLEIGGLYSHASGSMNGAVVSTFGGAVIQFLDGSGANTGYTCAPAPGQVCTTSANLSTTYSDWQLHGKVAGERRVGAILITPSVAVFGGNVRNDQTLAQTLTLSSSPNSATYNASTSLRWTDFGARAGLDLRYDVNPRTAVGLSGWAGFAGRHASLSGSDVAVDTLIAGFTAGASSISTSANATPFLANAEAGVAYKWLPTATVRGFVGLNYDSKVPGVSSPSFTGPAGGITSRTAAGLSFNSETSYYAGGGVTWTFSPAAR